MTNIPERIATLEHGHEYMAKSLAYLAASCKAKIDSYSAFSRYASELRILDTKARTYLGYEQKEKFINQLLQRNEPTPAYFGYAGVGDNLLLEVVTANAAQKTGEQCFAFSDFPFFFFDNPHVSHVFCNSDAMRSNVDFITFLLQTNIQPIFVPYWIRRLHQQKRTLILPAHHLAQQMCFEAGMSGVISIVPKLYFVDEGPSFLDSLVSKEYIVIQSVGKTPWKSCPKEIMQYIVDTLKNDFQFVQIGSLNDPLLHNTLDLRCLSLLQYADLLKNARLFVGNIGGLMHLSRAMNTRAAIAYSSVELLSTDSYAYNINVQSAKPCRLCVTGTINMYLGDRCPAGYRCAAVDRDELLAAVRTACAMEKCPHEETRTIDEPKKTIAPYYQHEYNAWMR